MTKLKKSKSELNKIVVKCGVCNRVSHLKDWKKAAIKNNRFIGGCPTCKGEFYDIVSE